MTYRDDDVAAFARRRSLAERVETTTDDHERAELVRELAQLDADRRDAARRRLPLLTRSRIASPCDERWETMLGEGAVRHCSRCEKKVFDLSRMTLGEAEALVHAEQRRGLCVRLHHRADGTMMFADCEVGARSVRRRRWAVGVAAGIAGSAALAWAAVPPPAAPLRLEGSATSAAVLREAGDAFLRSPMPELPVDADLPRAIGLSGVDEPGAFMGLMALPEPPLVAPAPARPPGRARRR
ncbi:MAG: hypothetical protein U0234_28520 [Sandaracinus sp.]